MSNSVGEDAIGELAESGYHELEASRSLAWASGHDADAGDWSDR